MAERTYELIELVGVSERTESEAVRNAVRRAAGTLQGLDWLEEQQIRGTIRNGDVGEFQVTLKLGFRLMTQDELHR